MFRNDLHLFITVALLSKLKANRDGGMAVARIDRDITHASNYERDYRCAGEGREGGDHRVAHDNYFCVGHNYCRGGN